METQISSIWKIRSRLGFGALLVLVAMVTSADPRTTIVGKPETSSFDKLVRLEDKPSSELRATVVNSSSSSSSTKTSVRQVETQLTSSNTSLEEPSAKLPEADGTHQYHHVTTKSTNLSAAATVLLPPELRRESSRKLVVDPGGTNAASSFTKIPKPTLWSKMASWLITGLLLPAVTLIGGYIVKDVLLPRLKKWFIKFIGKWWWWWPTEKTQEMEPLKDDSSSTENSDSSVVDDKPDKISDKNP